MKGLEHRIIIGVLLILFIAIGLAMITGCKAVQPSISNQEKDSTHVSETTRTRDTVIHLPSDKVEILDTFDMGGFYLEPLERDSARIKDIEKLIKKNGVAFDTLTISIKKNSKGVNQYVVKNDCVCDTGAITLKVKDKVINEYKSKEEVQTKTIEVKVHYWYDRAAEVLASILLILIVIMVVYAAIKLKL